MRGFPQRRRSVLFDGGKKTAEVGKQNREVKGTSRLDAERVARFNAARRRDVGAKRFLKRGDMFVEIEKFSGEKVLGSKALGAPDAHVVLGRTGLRGCHLGGADDWRAIFSYQR